MNLGLRAIAGESRPFSFISFCEMEEHHRGMALEHLSDTLWGVNLFKNGQGRLKTMLSPGSFRSVLWTILAFHGQGADLCLDISSIRKKYGGENEFTCFAPNCHKLRLRILREDTALDNSIGS